MNKSLSEQLAENFDKLEGITTEPVEIGQEPIEQEPEQPDRARDESGRFAKEDRPTLKLKEGPKRDPKTGGHLAETKPEGQESTIKTETTVEKGNEGPKDNQEPLPPPAEWKGDAKVAWHRLPYHVKKELSEDYKHVSEAKSLVPALQPYMERFTREFGGAPQALSSILGTWQYARTSPVDFVKDFVRQFNIDPGTLMGAAPQGNQTPQEQEHPVIAALQQELREVKGQLQHIAQQPIQAQNAQIDNDIKAFAADPAHPYYMDVKAAMQAILMTPGLVTQDQSGPAMLKEAYDMACHANPRIRAQLEAQKAAAAQEQRRQATARAVQTAASVTGSPGVARPNGTPSQSVLQSLSDNWDALSGRA